MKEENVDDFPLLVAPFLAFGSSTSNIDEAIRAPLEFKGPFENTCRRHLCVEDVVVIWDVVPREESVEVYHEAEKSYQPRSKPKTSAGVA